MSSSPSLPCVVEKCELLSLALCQCCKKDLCIDHLNEHANRRNEQLLPFVDKVNSVFNRLNEISGNEQSCLKQIDEWRQEAYKTVDLFCDSKRREFADETIDQQRQQVNEMQNKLNEFIRKKGGTQQDLDFFTESIQSIELNLGKVQQLQLTVSPLVIDDKCVCRFSNQTDLPEKASHRSELDEKSSHETNKSTRSHKHRSSRKRSRSPETHRSRTPTKKKSICDDCVDCHFYQDRFGPGFMNSFGPCSCKCHKWAFS